MKFTLSILAFIIYVTGFGQVKNYKTFKTDSLSGLNISFNIPTSWTYESENDGTGFLLRFESTDSAKREKYMKCSEGSILKLKYFYGKTIDQATSEMNLNSMGKNADMKTYTTSVNDYICIVLGFEFKGEGFNGLDCSFTSKVDCKGKKTKNGAAYQLIFFSNGDKTICLTTNGNVLDEDIKKEIKSSFKFL